MLYDIKNLQKSRSRGAGYKLLVRALRVREGERIAITGPSGCGKSTVLDMLGLALRPDEAETFDFFPGADGAPVRIMDVWRAGDQDRLAALRLSGMGYVLQSGELLPFLNVAENMELTARLGGRGREDARRDALALADKLGVSRLLAASPGTLSFGERQRAAIVRALASRPRVILADEPTASLDPFHAEKVMDAFMEAVQEYSAALILVTHNIAWAKRAGVREIRFELTEDSSGMTAILDGKS